jgi:hypothetical protein
VTAIAPPSAHAPWETRSASLPAAPVLRVRRPAARPSAVTVTPIAIPVVGAPIPGRHLVRAPWAEPLSAFAGVIVETRQVPDAWYRPRTAPERVMDPPVPAPRLAAADPAAARPLVAIPIVVDRPTVAVPARPVAVPGLVAVGAAPAAPVAASTIPVRVVPVAVNPDPAPVRAPRPIPVLTALGTDPTSVARTSAAPIDPVVPSPTPSMPAPARRGFLGRAVALTVGLVVSLVAYEAANRKGRR